MRRRIFFLFIIMFLLVPINSEANELITIRVSLSNNTSVVPFRINSGVYMLRDAGSNLPIAEIRQGDLVNITQAGNTLTVSINGVLQSGSFSGPIWANPLDLNELNVFSYRNVQYRDSVSVAIEKFGLLVVNTLDIEKYLYGVVGKEMGYTAPPEALKAQAVVSRSYAMAMRGKGLNFDVGVDQSTQVYQGYSAELVNGSSRVIDAVNQTKGELIWFFNEQTKRNEIVQAYFHANAGGHTENCENVWSNPLPYLQACPSPDDIHAVEHPDQSAQGWPANTYQWNVTLTREQVAKAIADYNKSLPTPVDIGEYREIRLFRLNRDGATSTASNRVTRMDLVGSRSVNSVYRDSIRRVFGLKSTLFEIKTDATVVIKDVNGQKHQVNETSTLMVVGGDKVVRPVNGSAPTYRIVGRAGIKDMNKQMTNLTFLGRGHGHGVGLSQWGARGMGHKGRNYREIIEHYYNGNKYDGRLLISSQG